MNNSRVMLFTFSCFLSMGVLIAPSPAKAQSDAHITQVKIPFAFHVGDEVLPAGIYRLENKQNHLIFLRGPNNKPVSVLVHDAVSIRSQQTGTVVFHRYGETYFLRQIWYRENPFGLECYGSRAEKSMLQASNNQLPGLMSLSLAPYGGSFDKR